MHRFMGMLLSFALMAAMLAGLATIAAASDTPMAAKAQVAAEIEALATGTGDAKDLLKAVEALEKGLDAKYWNADGTALAGKAEKTFDHDKNALKELAKADGHDVEAAMAALVDIDAKLAQALIDEAAAAGADTEKAEREMQKAAEELAKGKPGKAVDHYGKAWKEAAAASADKTKGGSGGTKYSVYDAVFVRADTVESADPVFLAVSGTNQEGTPGHTGSGNEGYVFSDAFGGSDTFLDASLWPNLDGGIMQLHVSCSDAFPDGVGAKSDPQPTSQWLVDTIHIVKYANGSVVKECDVTGQGLSTDPPPPTTTTTTEPPFDT